MSSQPLLTPQDLQQLQHQAHQLVSQRGHRGTINSGPQQSHYRGQGLELADMRPYQWGDDVRHMDWRATARSQRPIMKVYREERQEHLLLLVERHPGMGFATQGELKGAVAARAAALIAFAAVRRKAEVAGIITASQQQLFAPSQRLDPTLILLRAITAPLQSEHYQPIAPEELLHRTQQLSRHGSTIYLISDFYHWHEKPERLKKPLNLLSSQHTVIALQIVDPAEQQLPDTGRLRINSPFSAEACIIDSSDPQLRRRFAESMALRQQALQKLFSHCGVEHHTLQTNGDPVPVVAKIL